MDQYSDTERYLWDKIDQLEAELNKIKLFLGLRY